MKSFTLLKGWKYSHAVKQSNGFTFRLYLTTLTYFLDSMEGGGGVGSVAEVARRD